MIGLWSGNLRKLDSWNRASPSADICHLTNSSSGQCLSACFLLVKNKRKSKVKSILFCKTGTISKMALTAGPKPSYWLYFYHLCHVKATRTAAPNLLLVLPSIKKCENQHFNSNFSISSTCLVKRSQENKLCTCSSCTICKIKILHHRSCTVWLGCHHVPKALAHV